MRSLFFILSFIFLSSTCVGAEVVPIGRLFSTPAQRANLDRLRQSTKRGEAIKLASEEATPELPVLPVEPVHEQFSLDGFVRRSSGKGTTWINQVPQNEGAVSQNILVRQQLSKPPAVSILLPSGKRINLKVGQTFDTVSGRVLEVYESAPSATVQPLQPPKSEK